MIENATSPIPARWSNNVLVASGALGLTTSSEAAWGKESGDRRDLVITRATGLGDGEAENAVPLLIPRTVGLGLRLRETTASFLGDSRSHPTNDGTDGTEALISFEIKISLLCTNVD